MRFGFGGLCRLWGWRVHVHPRACRAALGRRAIGISVSWGVLHGRLPSPSWTAKSGRMRLVASSSVSAPPTSGIEVLVCTLLADTRGPVICPLLADTFPPPTVRLWRTPLSALGGHPVRF